MKYRQCRKAFSDLNFLLFLPLFLSFPLFPFVFVQMFSQDFIFLRSSVFRDFNSFIRYVQILPSFVASLYKEWRKHAFVEICVMFKMKMMMSAKKEFHFLSIRLTCNSLSYKYSSYNVALL